MFSRWPACSGVSRTAKTNQFAAFLENDVGGAADQVARIAGRDVGHGLDRAGRDDHAFAEKRPRRDGRADVARRMDLVGQLIKSVRGPRRVPS